MRADINRKDITDGTRIQDSSDITGKSWIQAEETCRWSKILNKNKREMKKELNLDG